MKKIKELQQKFKELYERGLSEKQRALAMVAIIFITFAFTIWIYNLVFGPKGSDTVNETKNSENLQNNITGPANGNTLTNSENDNQTNPANPAFIFPKADTNKNSNSYARLPIIPDTDYNAQKAQPPGPMDGTFTKIKEDYKNDPKIVLINGYLFYLKQVADGKRAWNDLYRAKATEYFGENKARELENEVKRINGDKDQVIRNRNFKSFEEIAGAVKKETDQYVEKSAIGQYLDHARDIAEDRYPWNEEAISLGEVNLEEAWVEQIIVKIRAIKERKARNFRSRSYNTIEELIGAIKNDTKNFKEITARDAYLDYVLTLAKNNALTDAVVGSGGYLLEAYHLEALSKFVKN